MTYRLGLTGSIGMGKSATAALFAAEGCAIWDADQAVHRLYGPCGAAVAAVAALDPEVIEGGQVSRARLRARIMADPAFLPRLEAIVHPLVAADRERFLRECKADIAVFDIPLLFENGSERMMDATVCVSIDPHTQRQRVMDRQTMTAAQFEAILARQLPDAEKRARADYVVITDTPEHARAQVQAIVAKIREGLGNA